MWKGPYTREMAWVVEDERAGHKSWAPTENRHRILYRLKPDDADVQNLLKAELKEQYREQIMHQYSY